MPLSFDPNDASFNRGNALYLAHAADIAYHRAPAGAAMDRLGLTAIAFRSKLTRVRGFLGVCETHAVLAFRGSDPITPPNWVTDAVVRLVTHSEYVGRVHLGFSSVLRHSWPRVAELLQEASEKPLFLTGHSMGGALAVLTACRLAKAGTAPMATYTFGAPRVGDAEFCSGYAQPTFRVVNKLDIIPEMPLAARPSKKLKSINEVEQEQAKIVRRRRLYDHVKTLVHIDHDGQITVDADLEPWTPNALARALASRGTSFIEGITDHLIANYIKGLEGTGRVRKTRLRRREQVE